MAWRVVVISNPARLRVEDSQLVIAQEAEVTLPLEDLQALILESPAITLTAALLARLGERDILLLACDDKHLPAAALLPFAGHSRLPKMQRMQLATSEPFRKRCWQAVIRRKIANQAECLRLAGRPGEEQLLAMVPGVASGDSTNLESRAARRYFRFLCGPAFLRGADDPVNAALNYGYAILRGAMARALAAHGLLLAQGIHHCSELNPFNLVDDFLEPFRPLVDLAVVRMMAANEQFEQAERRSLAELLGCDVLMEGKHQPVLRAVEITATSFVTACREKDAKHLKLPTVLPLTAHRYE